MPFGYLYFLFGEMSKSSASYGGWGVLLLSCVSCLCILEIKPLMASSFAYIFCHSVGCLFVLIMVSFSLQKLVSLIRSHLFAFAFCCLGILNLRKHCCDLSENILPIISSSFMVSCLMFKLFYFILFEFIFVHGVKES